MGSTRHGCARLNLEHLRGEWHRTSGRRGCVVVMSRAFPGFVALINPMADYGIDTYTHELARGLAENGVHVDVFTADVFGEKSK